jgi:hypothetical protein
MRWILDLVSASQIKTLDFTTTTTVNTTTETGQMRDTLLARYAETNGLIHTTQPVVAPFRGMRFGDTIKTPSPFVDHLITTPGRHLFTRSNSRTF